MMSGTSDFKIRAPELQRRAEADARAPETPETRRHGAVARKKAMVDMAQLEPQKKSCGMQVIVMVTICSLEFGRIIDHLYRFQSGI